MGDAYPDPEDKAGKAAVVDVGPVKKLPRPVTLAEIKADAAFKDFALVRISRLSVMPVSDAEWARIEKHERKRCRLACLLPALSAHMAAPRISLPTASTRSRSRRMFSPRMFFTSCSE